MKRHVRAVKMGMTGIRLANGKSACQILANRMTLLDMLQQIKARPKSTKPTKLIGWPRNTISMITPSAKARKPMTSARLCHRDFSRMV